MKCPFCNQEMRRTKCEWPPQNIGDNRHECWNKSCQYWYKGLPMCRYQMIKCRITADLHYESFMLEHFYVTIDYRGHTTTISKRRDASMTDPVKIEKAIAFDLSDLDTLVNKIKLYVLLS